MLAELLGGGQVLHGGFELIAFTKKLAHAHVHVCSSPQRGRGLVGRLLHSPLVGVHRLPETPLHEVDVSNRDGAADHVGAVPGLLQACHGIGIPTQRFIEIPARPAGERQEGGRRPTSEMIVLHDEVERPPGLGHRAGHIAEDQCLPGAVHGDGTGQTPKLLLVHHDHRGW